MEGGEISKAFLYRLLGYQQQAESFYARDDARAALFKPHLAYDIGRNFTDPSGRPRIDEQLHSMLISLLGAEELGGGEDATKSQLRRFYQEYTGLRNNIRYGGDEAYERNEVAIKMLIAKAVYARGRQNSKIPAAFTDWLSANLKAIKNKEDVETFGNYFEAFLGYFYGARRQSQGGPRR
jgi:CRISPR type III-A-associated protein Csm2